MEKKEQQKAEQARVAQASAKPEGAEKALVDQAKAGPGKPVEQLKKVTNRGMPMPGQHEETYSKTVSPMAAIENSVVNDVEYNQQVVEPFSNVNQGSGVLAHEAAAQEKVEKEDQTLIPVVATRNGYYDNARKKTGDVFQVRGKQALGSWMKKI